MASVAGDILY